MKKILILGLLLICSYIANAQIEPLDTDGDGYRNVSTLDHLRWISENSLSWSLNYKLDNDINAADTKNWNDGKGWKPIGTNKNQFIGMFDGKGFKIDSLFIFRPLQDTLGLFGYTNESSKIHNIKVTNCDIIGRSWIGGLAGWNNSQITECYTSGKVIGMGMGIGGLIGLSGSILSSCNYSTADVAGVDFTGGLIGYNGGTISDSYAMGNVNSSGSSCGGFIGKNSDDGNVKNCYSVGKVSGKKNVGGFIGKNTSYMITHCFWDKELSGQDTSAIGIGKTTQEMKTKSTFTDVQWNFTTLWKMDSSINNGYPYIDIIKIGKEPLDTDGDGYRNVSTLDNLRWISENCLSWSLNYKLDNDINAADTKNWNAGEGFKPIGYDKNPFIGIFDGQGYKIDSLYINFSKMDNVGFISITGSGAVIKNLGITNCYVWGSSTVGALIGYNNYGHVSHCYTTGKVHGGDYVGGLIGLNVVGPLKSSYSISNVAGALSVGGLVGHNQGTIQYCYSKGSVAGGTYTGGLAGFNGFIGNCQDNYSFSDVWGKYQYTGGLIGYSELTTIARCYSIGKVTGTSSNMGGFVGTVSQGGTSACFWDTETSGTENSDGGRGISTELMKTKSTFTSAGWNFYKIWNIDSTINNGYPFLDIRTKPKISIEPKDTDSDGYLNIKYYANLVWISENPGSWSSKFEVDNDISCDSSNLDKGFQEFNPIGNENTPFSGTFEGNGFKIDSLLISLSSQNYIGLFGRTDSISRIKNLNITNCIFIGNQFTGGLVGYNLGTIINCSTNGSITGNGMDVGGLVGITGNKSTIIYCYSTGTVTSNGQNLGGLVGALVENSEISNCYSHSKVNGFGSEVGGLVGLNENGKIINSYSKGFVNNSESEVGGLVGMNNGGSAINCFWDIGTSGKSYSAGGTGRNSLQMKTKWMFTDASWDFVNIWDNRYGMEDGYPYLIIKLATDVIETKQDISNLSLSPNPADDYITITLKPSEGFEPSEDSALQIFNTLGEMVLSVGTGRDLSAKINVSALPKGMYFVRIGNETAKFVKM